MESSIGYKMKITVAICCLNSEGVLPNTLATLRENTPKDISIIVVDDGSIDNTAKIAAVHGALVISHNENLGYAQARQSALENCDTEILAYIDDSCLIAQDWYSNLENLWESAPATTKIIAGLMEIHEPQGFLQKFQARHNPFLPLPASFSRTNRFSAKLMAYLKGKRPIRAASIASFSNGNVSMRVTPIKEIGGYDLRYSIGAEDEDLATRVIRQFGPTAIYFDQVILVRHVSDSSLKSFINRSYKYGRSSAFRFRLEGGLPTIMPVPVLVFILLAFALALQNYLVAIPTLLSIPLFYALRSRSFLYLIPDGYLLFISEIAHLSGFLRFLSKRTSLVRREMSSI